MAPPSLLRDSGSGGLSYRPTLLSLAIHVAILATAVAIGAGAAPRRRTDRVRVTFYDEEPPRAPEAPAPAPLPAVDAPASAAPGRARPGPRRVIEPLLPDEAPQTAAPEASDNPYDAPLPPVPIFGTSVPGAPTGNGTGTGVGDGSGEGEGSGTGAGPVYLSRDMDRPRLVSGAHPEYPLAARREGVEADVVVRIEIGLDGRVRDVRVLRGHPRLDEEVVRTVKSWRYSPATLHGRPLSVYVVQRIEFDLE